VRIELTVSDATGDHDVALVVPPGTTMRCVVSALAAAGLGGGDTTPWVGSTTPTLDAPAARSGLVEGCRLVLGPRPTEPAPVGLTSLDVVGGPSAGRRLALRSGRFSVGRIDCDLELDDANVSRRHAYLDVATAGVRLSDAGSTNGMTLDGEPVMGSVALPVGGLVRIGDSYLALSRVADPPLPTRAADERRTVDRPPRPARKTAADTFAQPQPPRSERPQRFQLAGALLPAAAGVAFAWWLGAAQFLFFALLSPLMLLTSAVGDRWHWRRSRRRAAREYAAAQARFRTDVGRALRREVRERRENWPGPAAVATLVTLPSIRLWERRPGDDDRLVVRLGLGEQPSCTLVTAGGACAPAGTLSAVPVTYDLRRGPLGLVGPVGPGRASARWLLAQLAAQHPPSQVRVALFLDAESAPAWLWARWLPHLGGRVATNATQHGVLAAELTREYQLEGVADGEATTWCVVVVDVSEPSPELAALSDLCAYGFGVTGVWLARSPTALPAGCRAGATLTGDTGTEVILRESDDAPAAAVLDQVALEWAADLARGLAPLLDCTAGATAGLPDSCTLRDVFGSELLDPWAILASWAGHDGGATATVGRSADGPAVLDLVRDGPHALVAGTTGSGKSALLRTLVAALSRTYPPEAMSFLLVDYKGGAAFAECAALPHVAGLVTDLDPQLTRRALTSLEAELLRRERLFADAGVSDLAGYRDVPGAAPLPRLVIVVDEFATLIRDLPDFVHGLVGIAQRGRSLGLHLVLATQRPGNAVTADIRANCTCRIALRVVDAAESTDVVDSPVAARIGRHTPGRAYVRVGPVLTAIQTASVDGRPATEDDELSVRLLGGWRGGVAADTEPPPRGDGLARFVDAVRSAVDRGPHAAATSPWPQPLPAELSVAELGSAPAGRVTVGLIDRPRNQRRDLLLIDPARPNSLLLTGGPGSGRTSALTTITAQLAAARAPGLLHLHVLDAGGGLAAVRALPHCGTYLGPGELDGAARLVERLGTLLVPRAAQPAGVRDATTPTLVLLVDGWEQLAAHSQERDGGRTIDVLRALARTGPGQRCAVVAAGDRATLGPRTAGAFGDRFVLSLRDPADAALAGLSVHDLPAEAPPGRGVQVSDGAEVQFASLRPVEDEQAAIARIAGSWHDSHRESDAAMIRIRPLPTSVMLAELPRAPQRFVLGRGGDGAAPLAVDLRAGSGRVVVAGPPRSGRSTLLRSLLHQARDMSLPVLAAGPARSPLVAEARALGIPVRTPSDGSTPWPESATVWLVDDAEAFQDLPAGDAVAERFAAAPAGTLIVAAGRTEDLVTSYRGLCGMLRRHRAGVLLRPGPVDGELFGVRLPRSTETLPPGRAVLIGEPDWLADQPAWTGGAEGTTINLQVAVP
jgi:S-DNA-T family DNA segregation ATPase FtsK/SpoIIIE